MRTFLISLMLMATVAFAAGQAAAATFTVQIDNFDGPYVEIAQGKADSGIEAGMQWRSLGYGAPTYYESMISNIPPGVPNEGTDAQNYVLARGDIAQSPYPNAGTGILANLDANQNHLRIDWAAFVQAHGGPAPDMTQPAVFTVDCMIAVDNLDHFYTLEITFDTSYDWSASKTVTRFTAKKDDVVNPAFITTTWYDDVPVVSFATFPTITSMPTFLYDFSWNTLPPGTIPSGVKFSVDDLKITYTPIAAPACNATPQDADGDGDVDLTDFGAFQSCFNGPNRPYGGPPEQQATCACMDVDPDDADVDLTDFGAFQSCFNGPNRPPTC